MGDDHLALLAEIERRYPDSFFKAEDAATFSGVSLQPTRKLLGRLCRQGLLIRHPRNRFALPCVEVESEIAAPHTDIESAPEPAPPDPDSELLTALRARLDAELTAEGLSPLEKLDLLLRAGKRAMNNRVQSELRLGQLDQRHAAQRLERDKLAARLEALEADNAQMKGKLEVLTADYERVQHGRDAAHALLERLVNGERLALVSRGIPEGSVWLPSGRRVTAERGTPESTQPEDKSPAPPTAALSRIQVEQKILALLRALGGKRRKLEQVFMEIDLDGATVGLVRQALDSLADSGAVIAEGSGAGLFYRAAESVAEPPVQSAAPPSAPKEGLKAAPKGIRAAVGKIQKAFEDAPPPTLKPAPSTEKAPPNLPRDLPPLRNHVQASDPTMQATILAALRDHGRSMSAAMLRSRVVVKDKRPFDGSLAALVSEGKVRQEGNQYSLVTS